MLGEPREGIDPYGLNVAGALASANEVNAEALPTEAGLVAVFICSA